MNMAKTIGCKDFPCVDVDHECCMLPDIDIDPERIFIIMIAECAPEDPNDYFYAGNSALFEKTTVQAFNDAGAEVSSIKDILKLGVYLTTAIKCRKKEYVIKANTIKECSKILENEISLFPNINAFMLMGDVAIKSPYL